MFLRVFCFPKLRINENGGNEEFPTFQRWILHPCTLSSFYQTNGIPWETAFLETFSMDLKRQKAVLIIVERRQNITWMSRDMKFLFKYWKIFLQHITMFWVIFWRFLRILQNCSKGQTNVSEHFPKISVDNQRLLKTSKEDLKLFWSYTNKFKCS